MMKYHITIRVRSMGYLRILALVGFVILAGCNVVSNEQPVAIIVTSPPILACEELVRAAMDTASDACIELEGGEACYGHTQVSAEFQPDAAVRFSLPGDSANLTTIRRIQTTALSEAAQTWGIAVVKAIIEQHEVLFVLYGDATLDKITPDASAASLSTRSGGASCGPSSAMLVQSSEDAQVTLNLNGVDITLGSTVHITAIENQAMTVATIEGTVVVAASNATRIVHHGAQVQVPLDGLDASGVPSEPAPLDIVSLQQAPLILLDHPVQLPQPIAGPTIPPISSTLATSTLPPATALPSATGTAEACNPRSDWTDTYAVQRGENLSSIARRFGLTVRELQEGNCLANPDLIRAGQVLQVPGDAPTDAPETIATNAEAETPTTVSFRADQATLDEGECTTIRWDVDNVTSVQFEEQMTTSHGSEEVCPTVTRSYRLVVVYPDERVVPYTLQIEVVSPPEATEEVR
jgi:LysM repeat protein